MVEDFVLIQEILQDDIPSQGNDGRDIVRLFYVEIPAGGEYSYL